MALGLGTLSALRDVAARGFYLEVLAESGAGDAGVAAIRRAAGEPWDATQLIANLDRRACERAKYDPFLPEALLKQSFCTDHLDAAGASRRLREAFADPVSTPVGSMEDLTKGTSGVS